MSVGNDILIVDDEIPNLQLLAELLEREGYKVRPAEKAQVAIDSALAKPPGLILLAVRMPEIDGFEVCRHLKKDKHTRNVPIIFISALQDGDARIKGFEAGGIDFITKPFREQEVLARVRTHLRLYRMQQNMERLVEERTAEMMAEFFGRQRAEEKYHTFVKTSSEGIWAYDLEPPLPMDLPAEDQFYLLYESAYIAEANDTVARMLGYKKGKELLGMSLDNFLPRTDPDCVAYMEILVREKFNVTDWESAEYGSDGEKRNFLSNIQGIIEDGKLLRIWGTSRDITKQKIKEKELQQSEARFRHLMEQSPLAMEILNPHGQIVKINKAWLQLWGVNAGEAKEVIACYNMLEDEQLTELGVDPLVRKAFAGEPVILPMFEYSGQRTAEEISMPHLKVNTVWIQSHLFPIKNKKGEVEFVVNTYNAGAYSDAEQGSHLYCWD
jgi:PAS domain S-box-containing protein